MCGVLNHGYRTFYFTVPGAIDDPKKHIQTGYKVVSVNMLFLISDGDR
jgi:hypothetical protein